MLDNNFSFASLMASSVHDLKNILGIALESVDWLFDTSKNLNSEQKAELEKVAHNIAHVNSELMQLLYFYKFEHQQYKLSLENQDIESFVNMQAAFFKSLIRNHNIKFTQEFDPALTWYFDDVLLTTAVRNAVMNSMKHAKSKIVLNIDRVDKYLCISVEDNGPGFPDQMLGVLDNKMHKGEIQTNGTGLGLFFANQVANMHVVKDKHGYIKLEKSALLGGAKFSIYLP
jgi:K+-sensing histidine kinase KdpD